MLPLLSPWQSRRIQTKAGNMHWALDFFPKQPAGLLLKPRPIRKDTHAYVSGPVLFPPPPRKTGEIVSHTQQGKMVKCALNPKNSWLPSSSEVPRDASALKTTHEHDFGRKTPRSTWLPFGKQVQSITYNGSFCPTVPSAFLDPLGRVLTQNPQQRSRKERATERLGPMVNVGHGNNVKILIFLKTGEVAHKHSAVSHLHWRRWGSSAHLIVFLPQSWKKLPSLRLSTRWSSWFALHAKLLQSRPTLCNPVDRSPPGPSVYEILQARILEWVAMPSPGNLSNPGIEPESYISCIGRWVLYP